GQFMVDLDRKLVAVFMAKWDTLKKAISNIRLRHKLIQQIKSSLVHASSRDLTARKNIRIERAVGDWTTEPQCGKASGTAIQNIGIGKSPRKSSIGRKVARPFRSRGNCDRVTRSPTADAVTFISHEKECFVFLDWPAQSRAELILEIIQFRSVKESFGIQVLVAEKFVTAAVD